MYNCVSMICAVNSGAQWHSAGAMQWLCNHVGLPSEFEKYMPPLRLSEHCSARLKECARQTLTMASSNISSKAHTSQSSQPVKPQARGSARGRGRGRALTTPQPTQSQSPQQHIEPPTKDSQPSSAGNVNWDNNPTLTTSLIQWLLAHPADRHILFHDHASTHTPVSGDRASGKNKKEVQAVITRHLFEKDPNYGSAVSQSEDLGWSNNPNTTPTKDYKIVRVVVYLRGVQRGYAEEGEEGIYTNRVMQTEMQDTPGVQE